MGGWLDALTLIEKSYWKCWIWTTDICAKLVRILSQNCLWMSFFYKVVSWRASPCWHWIRWVRTEMCEGEGGRGWTRRKRRRQEKEESGQKRERSRSSLPPQQQQQVAEVQPMQYNLTHARLHSCAAVCLYKCSIVQETHWQHITTIVMLSIITNSSSPYHDPPHTHTTADVWLGKTSYDYTIHCSMFMFSLPAPYYN